MEQAPEKKDWSRIISRSWMQTTNPVEKKVKENILSFQTQ